MKNKITKISVLALALLICAFSFVSCGDHIKDKNGPDDHSVSFSEKDLLSGSTTFTATNGYDVKEEGNVYSYADEKSSGIKTICEIDPEADKPLTFKVDSTLTEGNLKIYVMLKGNTNQLVGEIPVGEGETFAVDAPEYGKYMLRIAAESANFDIKVTVVNE